MEQLLVFLFWLAILLVAYTYLVYPGLMWLLGEKMPALAPVPDEQLPNVAVLMYATQPDEYFPDHLHTFFETSYPAGKLEVWVAHPDTTGPAALLPEEFLQSHPGINFLPVPAHAPAAGMQQRLVAASTAPILVFSDPGTSIKAHSFGQLARHYAQPDVGGVQLRMLNVGTLVEQVLEQEIIYTRYDQRIQQGESKLGLVIGAQPACYSIRRELFVPAPEEVPNGGLFSFMEVLRKGFKLAFAVDAVYSTQVTGTLEEQFEERTKRSEGNYRRLKYYTDFLNPLGRGATAVMFWSHKVLRWFTPHLLILALLLHLVLAFGFGYGNFLLWLHLGIYAIAALDLLLAQLGMDLKALRIIRHFTVINLAQLLGFWRYIKGRKAAKSDVAETAGI